MPQPRPRPAVQPGYDIRQAAALAHKRSGLSREHKCIGATADTQEQGERRGPHLRGQDCAGGCVDVAGVPLSTTTCDIFRFFAGHGAPPVETWLEYTSSEERPAPAACASAVVSFATNEHVRRALDLSGSHLMGRAIRTRMRDAAERMPVPDDAGGTSAVDDLRVVFLRDNTVYLYIRHKSLEAAGPQQRALERPPALGRQKWGLHKGASSRLPCAGDSAPAGVQPASAAHGCGVGSSSSVEAALVDSENANQVGEKMRAQVTAPVDGKEPAADSTREQTPKAPQVVGEKVQAQVAAAEQTPPQVVCAWCATYLEQFLIDCGAHHHRWVAVAVAVADTALATAAAPQWGVPI